MVPFAVFPQLRGEMPLASVHREYPPGQGEVESVASVKPLSAEIHAARLYGKIRVTVKKGGDNVLVLPEGERAGGINQRSPCAQTFRGAVENRELSDGARPGMLRRPLGNGARIPAEHSLAGAGSVHKHAVEASAQTAGKPVRVRI